MTQLHDFDQLRDNWTPAEDSAIAAREAAKLRVFDAHREDEPHWRDDDAGCFAKGLVAGISISLTIGCVIAFVLSRVLP